MESKTQPERDLLDLLDEERSAQSLKYAELIRRSDIVLQLVPIRRSLGMTQQQVADRMGVARDVVGRIESSPTRMSMDKIFAYAVALGAKIVIEPPAAA